jgi:hypothetical protein
MYSSLVNPLYTVLEQIRETVINILLPARSKNKPALKRDFPYEELFLPLDDGDPTQTFSDPLTIKQRIRLRDEIIPVGGLSQQEYDDICRKLHIDDESIEEIKRLKRGRSGTTHR